METSSGGTADVQAELQEYLNSKNISAIFVELVEDLLMNKPENAVEFIMNHLMKKYPKETENIKKGFLPSDAKAIQHSDDDDDHEVSSVSSSEIESMKAPPSSSRRNTMRRSSITAEKLCPIKHFESEIKIIPKTDEEATHIREVLSKNILFGHLDETQMKAVQNAMFLVTKEEGDVIIQQGDDGDNFYIIDEGFVEVFKESEKKKTNGKDGDDEKNQTITEEPERKLVASYEHGDFFGELAIMYNAPRAATCVAKSAVKLWALDRTSFKIILMQTTISKRNLHKEFLCRVPILSQLTEYEVLTASDSLEEDKFEDGEMVFRQGDNGDKFYIVKEGTAVCTKTGIDGEQIEVARLTDGSYFGEIALVTTKPRQATVTASGTLICLSMCRRAFKRVLGPIQDILMRNMEEYNKFQANHI